MTGAQESFIQEAKGIAGLIRALEPRLYASVLVAQMADETGWGTSELYRSAHNAAGITIGPPTYHYAVYPTWDDFAKGYVATIHNGLYGAVLAADSAEAQARALGASPWAASKYESVPGVPGSALLEIMQDAELYRLDLPAEPKQAGSDEMTIVRGPAEVTVTERTAQGATVGQTQHYHLEPDQYLTEEVKPDGESG